MSYTKPAPADLKSRYAAFAAVEDATVQYWLTDAERGVDTTWLEADYAPALIALAAHNMTLNQVAGIAGSEAAKLGGSGVTMFRSSTFHVQFSEDNATRMASGELDATRYGVEYLMLLDKSKGGPRVTPSGTLPHRDIGCSGPFPPHC